MVAQSAVNHILWSGGHKFKFPLPLSLRGHIKKKTMKMQRKPRKDRKTKENKKFGYDGWGLYFHKEFYGSMVIVEWILRIYGKKWSANSLQTRDMFRELRRSFTHVHLVALLQGANPYLLGMACYATNMSFPLPSTLRTKKNFLSSCERCKFKKIFFFFIFFSLKEKYF